MAKLMAKLIWKKGGTEKESEKNVTGNGKKHRQKKKKKNDLSKDI